MCEARTLSVRGVAWGGGGCGGNIMTVLYCREPPEERAEDIDEGRNKRGAAHLLECPIEQSCSDSGTVRDVSRRDISVLFFGGATLDRVKRGTASIFHLHVTFAALPQALSYDPLLGCLQNK